MPRFTGVILTRSPSTRNTTSIGLGASPGFFGPADLLELVPASDAEFVPAAAVDLVATSAVELVRSFPALSFLSSPIFLGTRMVTLWMGTVSTLVRDRKSTRLNSSHGYISYAV